MTLRDQMLAAPEDIEPANLPTRFAEARDAIRRGIAQAAATGITDATILAVLMSETLPRLVFAYGPERAGIILARLARDIGSGAAPNCRPQ